MARTPSGGGTSLLCDPIKLSLVEDWFCVGGYGAQITHSRPTERPHDSI